MHTHTHTDVPLLAAQIMQHNEESQAAQKIELKGIAVGNGCIGYGVDGGCGKDSLALLVQVLEREAPGVDPEVLTNVHAMCGNELDAGKGPMELSAQCRPAVRRVLEEIAEYNQYSWGSPCGPDGSGNWGDGTGFSCGGDEVSGRVGGKVIGSVLPPSSPNCQALSAYLSRVDTQRALHVIPENATKALSWEAW